MQSLKRPGRTAPKRLQAVVEPEPEGVEPDDEFDAYDTFEMYRVICPDCAQPIALLSEEDSLPEHARVLSPWNPFGLTACAGTGRSASEARSADESVEPQEQETALLLTLPQGLDWRTQPFSHVGGPGSRPMRVPVMRRQQPEPRQADQRQAA
ncbi:MULTISPECIES: hypothetical protein [Streptomyces]|uniref:Uncharacterized protein n=1 Tax=Streptomyces caniscabiei TaxID=2746961 RepID=A0ABU4MX91_9ACTN|nr:MULTISPECIES: hypothetical protein [Streptomyces]MBE4736756.1 hypothetical protein [Streptomyces caniscabiei]MBE4759770.1 hypothetical protein [Streptomyces caniscabiei]MBE4770680.1 hypothetical protein [Streptomyces caniscabiei]MBE4786217.1 hypothetical protein [Streptomyces caniscabiei]MBE4796348.1 hypothetical protein [Streptomyces caniscabiei]